MLRTLIAAALFSTMTLTGCISAVKLDLPSSFVEVDEDEYSMYDMRGVSADGVVVAARRQENPKQGTLEFWSEAIKNELQSSKGYTLTSSDKVTSAKNLPGKLMSFVHEQSGVKFMYLLAVFVKDNDILIAEAGGKVDAVKPHLEEIKKSLLSIK